MATKYEEIYSIFLNDIRDRKLVTLLTPDELGDTLEDYLLESVSIRFKKCKKNLEDRDDVLKCFNETLTREEQIILAKGMKLKWLSSNFISNEQQLNARLTTKDYNVFSPANQLRVLMSIEAEFKKELKSLITRYLYDNYINGGV